MNILELKRIFYLFITLGVVGVLATSCEKEIIGASDTGVKFIELEDTEKTQDNSVQLKRGNKKIYLKPQLLKKYSDFLFSKKRLSKKEFINAISEVTLEELQRNFGMTPVDDGVIILPLNPIIPTFGSDCEDLPNGDMDVSCGCRDLIYDLYIDAFLDHQDGTVSCEEVAELNCNFIIAAANCGKGAGPIEDEDCAEAYSICP